MKYQVFVVSDAEDDLFDLYQYVAQRDSPDRATLLLNSIREICASLADLPHRGHVPPELDRLGVGNYLEIRFKPYRIIYQILGRRVLIHCVLDGRRDLEDVLQRRLLR